MKSAHYRAAPAVPVAILAALCLSVVALLALVPSARAASGDLAWQRVYNGPGNGVDQYLAAARAPNGGVYAAGWRTNLFPLYQVVVARFSSSGARLWLRASSGDGANGVAADRLGNVVAVGQASLGVMAVVKYGPGGGLKWRRTYDDPTSDNDVAVKVALDATGNVYVAAARHDAASGSDIVLIKYSPSGVRRWVRRYAGPGANDDSPRGIAPDGAGNVYVTGYSLDGGTGDGGVITLKYDPTGHRRWLRRWDGTAGGNNIGDAIAVTASGTVYVAGQTVGTSTSYDAVVLKYSTSGALKWSRVKTSAGAFLDSFYGIALLGNGDVAATGSYYGGLANGNDVYLVRLSPAGQTRWARTYSGPDSLDDEGDNVASGPSGIVYVSGVSAGAATGYDFLTLKYSAAGQIRWARRYGSSGAMDDYAQALVVRSAAVYVAGYQGSATSGGDATLLKYRP